MALDATGLKDKVKALQASTIEKEMISILKDLKAHAKVNEKLLRETKAGLAVGKLRSHASKEVSELAKDLVRTWKNEVEKAKAQGGPTTPTAATGKENGIQVKTEAKRPPAISTIQSAPNSSANNGSPTTPRSASDLNKPRSAASDGVKINHTGDRTRDTCTQLVYDALASDSGAPNDLILKRSQAIEATIYQKNGSKVQGEYRTKIRSLCSNLKDKNNRSLRENIISGDLTVAKLCSMTSKDMASDERKEADEKLKKEAMFNTLAAGEAEAETDAFQCGKCKKWKTRYRQAQTRSADEPMTTFVTCTNCGNRWKFS